MPTPLALNVVSALPVENAARLLEPEPDPASIVKASGAQPPLGACHDSVTEEPATAAVKAVGGLGALAQPPEIVTVIPLDGALVPLGLRARTRTK